MFYARLAGVLGGVPLGEGVMEDLAWTLSLRSRVTTGQGCNQGEASPTYAFKAYLLCEISILIYGGIWLFLGHEVVQFLVRFPVHGVFE